MFRCRRLYRPMALLSMAMACSVVGYLVILHNDTSVHTILTESKEDIQEIRSRQFPGPGIVTRHQRTPDTAEFEKLGKIAALLDMDILGNDSYKQVQNKILQIETILEKFRTKGDDKQANNVLQEIKHLLLSPNPKSAQTVKPVNGIEGVQPVVHKAVTQPTDPQQTQLRADNIDTVDILEHIEDLLEQPEIPPPPVPNIKLDMKPYIKDPRYNPSQCLKTGIKYAEQSAWFKTRYIPDIKVFMDKEDVNNFTNYYKLSHYGLPFGVKGQDRRLLARVLNNPNFTNPNLKDNRPECVRCAVVGSGGVLNGSNVGPEIDAHDYVFRVNRALTKDRFAKDVGTRTSFYTFFPESQYVKEIQDKTAAHFIFAQFKTYDVNYASRMVQGLNPPPMTSRKRQSSWSVSYFYAFFKPYDMEYSLGMLSNDTPPMFTYDKGQKHWTPPKPNLDVSKLKIVHPDFMRYVFTRFLDSKAYRPTTGALVAFLAVHLCDEVSMYGFGYDSRFPIHYYDSKIVALSKASVGSHDVDNERVLWRKLNSENIVHFFNRTTV